MQQSNLERWHLRIWGSSTIRGVIGLLIVAALIAGAFPQWPVSASSELFAQTKKKPAASDDSKTATKGRRPAAATPTSGPADFASKNFLLHTDLSPEEAQDLLKRLETMLSLISKYWARPPSGIIECYVVKDLRKWPSGVLSPEGLRSIQGQAGVTASVTSYRGGVIVAAKATVYAVADRGTPQHEAVHAYCAQTFGTTGPVWYAEGMAEMGQYWKDGDSSVNAHQIVIDYLREAEPKSLNEIVNGDEVTGDSWQNYAWRWALCHMLATNTNYAPRFRPLGLALLTRQETSFEHVYGDMAPEITFEYLQFLKHMERGYRVDLCSWDWKAKFKRLNSSTAMTAHINAGLGWQPSRMKLVSGEEYEYSVAGSWSTGEATVDASGAEDGTGKLVGVLLHDYELGEPIELGNFGSFTAPKDGDLYLRCQDKWNEIADNKGKVTMRLKLKGKGKPLDPPKASTSTKGKKSSASDSDQ